MKLGAVVLLVAGVSFVPSIARADEPPAPAPPADDAAAAADETAPAAPGARTAPPPPPRDIVRLKNGGMIRGTIIELSPGSPVVIQLPTGDIRKIPWADTIAAGPEKVRAPAVEEPSYEQAAPPKKRMRSPGLLGAGIAAAGVSPLGLAVAAFGWVDQKACENERDADTSGSISNPVSLKPSYHCDNTGVIVGGIVTTVALLGAGIPMILYGAQRVPAEAEKEGTVRFVPWSRGTTGAGGSLQVRF